jgi:class 3 adenylate cyclase/TolB-like protein/cytochrome c-type biogenesis protein CcmH/NrfG
MERRLSAILAADVVGYSSLMEQDETGTIQRLRSHRQELFEPEITKHHGRIFKLMGDGLLAEFGSAVDAVECAVALQRGLAERNINVQQDQQIHARIGINMGEVVVEGDDRIGESVNIASRLEQLAPPGGIYVSGKVAKEVEKKLSFAFEPKGQQRVKNISEPISVYSVKIDGIPRSRIGKTAQTQSRHLPFFVIIAIMVGLSLIVWSRIDRGEQREKPVLAVVPIEYAGSDDRWKRFSNGVTDGVIADLSKSKDFLVMSRNATEKYAGAVQWDPRAIGSELDVQYVLSGSIDSDADNLRLNARLVSTSDGSVIWAERFERPVTDLFAIQDELTTRVATALGGWQGAITQYNENRALRKDPSALQAYDYLLLGGPEQAKMTRDGAIKAREYYFKALAIEPKLQRAIREIALTYMIQIDGGTADNVEEAKANALKFAKQAVDLEPNDPKALINLGFAYLYFGDFAKAEGPYMKAIDLSQSDVDLLILAAGNLFQLGHPEMAPELVERAIRLDPHYAYWWNFMIRWAYFYTRDFERALAAAKKIDSDAPNDLAYLAMINAQLSRVDDASAAAKKVVLKNPDWSAEYLVGTIGGVARENESNLLLESAKKAGLADCMTVEQVRRYPEIKQLKACALHRAGQ